MAIKIYIDQGHNPRNPNAGAEGNGLREQDVVYRIGTELAELLRANGNFDVRLSRNSPTEILGNSNASSLAQRVNDANSWEADYFISLHTNASESPNASGVEAFVFRLGTAAAALAEDVVIGISDSTGSRDRGVFARPGLYVLKKTEMPTLLVELGFISNPSEAELMNTRPNLYARGIYNGILNYFNLS